MTKYEEELAQRLIREVFDAFAHSGSVPYTASDKQLGWKIKSSHSSRSERVTVRCTHADLLCAVALGLWRTYCVSWNNEHTITFSYPVREVE